MEEFILEDNYQPEDWFRKVKPIKYYIDENKCFICTSHAKSGRTGYYKIKRYGKLQDMHTYIYKIYKGEINKELVVRHLCNNKFCINPEHLESGTYKQNAVDKSLDMPLTNWLNKNKVKEIKLLIDKGYKNIEIAEMFDLKENHVSRIRNNTIWKDI